MPDLDTRDADDWWDTLPDKRRVEIWRWVEQPHRKGYEPAPGQLDLMDAIKERRRTS
ncbi:hypothetical protein HMPREF0298_1917 [Corynebacterium lipophiloflavum DSM 44291]|uniref:Uncharacterized protein n=1 Tax=Corynebacterium lipophiloflavum (strain ATCC 700352 / DSM 44291 / CCUG 37336 / JCM 10383 / DMMZ 1944) TaxID=525263 RepID=C0XTZ7_CORLD|nr:hypothetical protein HMPREF0298_1917 [Corynebacterium lipophiloflavum DSM 44291]